MDGSNKNRRYFTCLYILIITIISLLGIEITVYLFSKVSRLKLATKSEIVTVAKSELEESKIPTPVNIPHPYFGYIYNPSKHLSQFNYVSNTPLYMESNSDGFIDEEFPIKKKGLFIIGLMGGSGAMSWGVEKNDHIAYKLEKMLNTYLINDKYREYRVLNMGVGSHILYQTSHIYLYYKNLLDGVIFYGGFNECAHGAMLPNDDPIQFPVINLYASLQNPSPLILEISNAESELDGFAKFLANHPYLIHSPAVRLVFNLKAKRIKTLHAMLQDEGHQTALPSIKGKFKKELRGLFPWITAASFLQLQSFDYDNPDIPKVIKKILPLVYTDPVLNAYVVSKTANAHFLSVIQPMMYITGKETNWKAPNFVSYHFQKSCVEKLEDEAKKLEIHGIKTYNLNGINKNAYKKDFFFIDQVHLKKEGTEVVASSLFEIIKKEWHQ